MRWYNIWNNFTATKRLKFINFCFLNQKHIIFNGSNKSIKENVCTNKINCYNSNDCKLKIVYFLYTDSFELLKSRTKLNHIQYGHSSMVDQKQP